MNDQHRAPVRGGSYASMVLLCIVAMCPALINFTALDMMSQTMATSIGVSATDMVWVSMLGNAAFPFGYVVAADVAERFVLRNLVVLLMGVYALSSLGATAAPNLPILVVAHVIQGFSAGVVSNLLIAPTVSGYPRYLPITVCIFDIGLFSATTWGPTIGGVVEQKQMWRELFGLNVILGLVAMVLAWFVLAPRPTTNPRARVDVAGLSLSGGGLLLLFIGVAKLSYVHWPDSQVVVPIALGVGCFVFLFVAEWLQREPLLAIRDVVQPGPLSGTVLSCMAAFTFGGLISILAEFLLEVRGLSAQDAGLRMVWAPLAALVGSGLVGLIFTRPRWVMPLGIVGVLVLALAAAIIVQFARFTGDSTVALAAGLLGLGAGTSVVPAMIVAALSVPAFMMRRTLALITMLRYALLAVSEQVLSYLVGVWQTIHFQHLTWQQAFQYLLVAPAAQSTPAVETMVMMSQGLVLAINDAALFLVVVTLVGATVGALIPRIRRVNPPADSLLAMLTRLS